MESCCAVLVYDILCQPSKYSYNLEYIKKAVNTLSLLVADEPVTTAINSIRRVLSTIEQPIDNTFPKQPTSEAADASDPRHQASGVPLQGDNDLNRAEQMIFLSNGAHTDPHQSAPLAQGGLGSPTDQDWLNPNYFNLNIMTTDLFNFFPLNMSTPLDPTPLDYTMGRHEHDR
jgi:hypothetical protein